VRLWANGLDKYHCVDRYLGEWYDGKFDGKGTYWWPPPPYGEGGIYEGDFKRGHKTGRGDSPVTAVQLFQIRTRVVGPLIIVWKLLMLLMLRRTRARAIYMHLTRLSLTPVRGPGAKTWQDGTKYDGNWENDLRHGHGILTRTDGTVYAGQFSQEKRHGKGALRWGNGYRYDGDFESDVATKGVYSWFEGPTKQLRTWVWPDHRRQGEGVIVARGELFTAAYEQGREVGRRAGALAVREIALPQGKLEMWQDGGAMGSPPAKVRIIAL